ncbi:LIM and senescent cell antigen-like-containing domain protein 1 isoform X1 [Culex pipiens pallens]|uniref:LIM and senescent cell antigen-like-containing domain protein 1 isoform X1 n=1 Tax=Culex pipiens pallens TaxID=42434 RepID=UPI0019537167|nr:LIM and senescent cell antigen-like-containing domain protein 1 isoform X1 [Culex pipiens pallens]
MSELKLQSLENSSLYKRRTTSRENLLQVAGGEPFRRPTTPTMAERLYQNGPSIRNPNATTTPPLYSNIADKHFSPQQPSSSALLAADAIVRDLSSVNLGSGSSTGYQNVPLPLASSTPVRRKMELREQSGRSNVEVIGVSANMSLGSMMCTRCDEGFEPHERIVNSNGQLWHTQCFVCAQCFRQFQDGIFYEFEGRKYCEKDFHILFAPCCNKCNDFVIGRVIKAMAANWHPDCFTCERCSIPLADSGFIRNQNRALCHDCNRKEKEVGLGKHVCNKCHGVIDDAPLRFRGEVYHGYHFNCTSCGVELDSSAREVKNRTGYAANDMNELYCLRCHDRMGIPICGACRRPIEERVVTALGKHWHVEHFVCAKCEKPFLGHRHYEKRGLAYCETHYHQLFGNLCFVCNQVIAGDVFTALNKAWCVHHFSCSICDNKMDQKSKFYEYDEKPVCKKCYERFPNELRRRLRMAHENTLKKVPVA